MGIGFAKHHFPHRDRSFRGHVHLLQFLLVARSGRDSHPPTTGSLASIAFYLDHDVSELLRAIENKLMRCLRWDAQHVSHADFLACAPFDRAIALLMGRNGLSVDERAAHNQCGGAGLHEDNVYLRFMPLGRTVGLTMNEKYGLIGEIPKLLDREMMGIGSSLLREGLGRLGHGRSRPVLESIRRSGLRRYDGKRGQHEEEQPEFSHEFHLVGKNGLHDFTPIHGPVSARATGPEKAW